MKSVLVRNLLVLAATLALLPIGLVGCQSAPKAEPAALSGSNEKPASADEGKLSSHRTGRSGHVKHKPN